MKRYIKTDTSNDKVYRLEGKAWIEKFDQYIDDIPTKDVYGDWIYETTAVSKIKAISNIKHRMLINCNGNHLGYTEKNIKFNDKDLKEIG